MFGEQYEAVYKKREEFIITRQLNEERRQKKRKQLLRKKIDYDSWFDKTVTADDVEKLHQSWWPRFPKKLLQLTRAPEASIPKTTVAELLQTEPFKCILRAAVKRKLFRKPYIGYERWLTIQYGKEMMAKPRQWWQRANRERKYLERIGTRKPVMMVLPPLDFFGQVWLEAFCQETRMILQDEGIFGLHDLRDGLGKHAFAFVVSEIRSFCYGSKQQSSMEGILNRERIVRHDRCKAYNEECIGRFNKRKRPAEENYIDNPFGAEGEEDIEYPPSDDEEEEGEPAGGFNNP